MLYALRGAVRAAVGRFGERGYRGHSRTPKTLCGPANGLYCGFAFWGLFRPAGYGRKNDACGPLEGLQAAGRWRGVYRAWARENPPQKAQDGHWRYSRFFRRLPDNHNREQQDKQNNQAGVTSILRRAGHTCVQLMR